jgi:hypothetical protein
VYLGNPVQTGDFSMSDSSTDLDRPLWGGAAIAIEANLLKDGSPDIKRAYYLLELGLLPGTKVGKIWTSTPRRLRAVFSGEAA